MAALYGRDIDLAMLNELLTSISPVGGRIAVAVAEAGGGKTSLFERFLQDVSGPVAWGACVDGEGAPPFWPWSQILRRVASDSDRGRLAAEALHALSAGGGDDVARFAAFETVARALAAPGPAVILVVDDLQWADGASLQLLQFLAPVLRRAPVLLLVASRPTAHPEVMAALGALARHGSVRLPLRPLDAREIGRVFADAGADPGSSHQVAALTGGNPFFVRELARQATPGRDPHAVPGSIAEVVAGELSRLSAGARSLAFLCAMLDGDIAPDLALRAGCGEAASFRELVSAGFLVAARDGYRFRHDILRDALRSGLLPHERRSYDAAIAETARAAGNRMLVAIHGCRAGEAWDAAAAHAAALAERDSATGLFAFESAADLTDLARQVRPAVPLSDHDRLALEIAEGELYTRAGRVEQAREVLRDAAVLARSAADAHALARIALTFGLGYEHGNAYDPEVIALLEEALALLPPASHAHRARVLARLSWQSLDAASLARRKEYSAQAVREARLAEDPGALAMALNAHCWALALPGDLAERRQAASEAEAAATDAGDAEAELGALMWRFRSELEAGEVDNARAAARRFRTIVTRSPLPYHAWYADLFEGTLALIEGNLDRAAQAAASIDPIATTQEVQARVNAATLADETELVRGMGTSPAAIEALHRLHALADESMGIGWMLRAHLVALTQGRAAACRELDHLLPRAAPSAVAEDWFILMASLASAAVLAGSPIHAREIFNRLEPYADHWVVVANGASSRGPVASHLAALAGVAGMPEAAALYRQRALAALEKAGAMALAFWIGQQPLPAPGVAPTALTPRETEILSLLAQGLSNQEIAATLVLSVRTVQRHVENLYGRLDVHNRAQVVLEAVRRGLLDPSNTAPRGTG